MTYVSLKRLAKRKGIKRVPVVVLPRISLYENGRAYFSSISPAELRNGLVAFQVDLAKGSLRVRPIALTEEDALLEETVVVNGAAKFQVEVTNALKEKLKITTRHVTVTLNENPSPDGWYYSNEIIAKMD